MYNSTQAPFFLLYIICFNFLSYIVLDRPGNTSGGAPGGGGGGDYAICEL
jgi:hypothetical protein